MSRTVLTIGTFDLLHFGHIAFLQQCALLGDDLIVGVNTDWFVRQYKSPPVLSQEERRYGIEQLGYVSRDNNSPGAELIDSVRPEVLAIGSDWATKDYYAQICVTQEWLDSRRIVLAYIPRVQNRRFPMSASEIRRRVLESDPGGRAR